MAISKDTEKKVKIVFQAHSTAKEFHFTSDGQAFSMPSDAKNHAKTLEAKEVTKITRAMVNSGKFEIDQEVYDKAEKPQLPEGAKNEFQAKGSANESTLGTPPKESQEDKEREALAARYSELAGKKAAHNIGIDKLKASIDEMEAEQKKAEKATADAAEKAKKEVKETPKTEK